MTFVGSVEPHEVPGHLSAGDVFVRPSRSEGFGNAFVEAMAVGLPVVATPVGGIVDFIQHKETGILCEPDNPESLAQEVYGLMTDDALRTHVAQNAQEMVKSRYDWDLIALRMQKEVFELL